MEEIKKYLDIEGLKYLYNQLSLEDYPNNETLVAILNAIDESKADKDEIPKFDVQLITWTDEDYALQDFEYIKNDKGIYEVTAWKGTYQGELSTNMIFPEDVSIALKE